MPNSGSPEETQQWAVPAGNAGSTVYTPFSLYIYDWWVLWITNQFAWKCSTSKFLLPLFRATMGEKHLDIGVATGYYPAQSITVGSSCRELTLVDLSLSALDEAKRRILKASSSRRPHIVQATADATKPLPFPPSEKFDSVSMFYLLHCMPGPPERKMSAFDVARQHLAADGVLAGATVLGKSRPMNWLAKVLMTWYNYMGVFDNWDDTVELFADGLRRNFEEVEVWVVGRVMLFTAKRPRLQEFHEMRFEFPAKPNRYGSW